MSNGENRVHGNGHFGKYSYRLLRLSYSMMGELNDLGRMCRV
jgi:hypothetical protein